MIIKRKNNRLPHPKDLFLVSSLDDLEGEYMYPGVPKNMLTRSGYEDNKTPRISLFPSVNSGVMNLGRSGKNLEGSTLYVYHPVGGKPESLMKPDISQSPGSQITNELWYLASMRFKKIAEIKVGKKILPGHVYHYGPRSTTDYIYEWDWEEILEPWEKKGKLEEKEFGIVSDLIHSGIPRTYKKYIGRTRRNLGNRIGKSIENDAKKFVEAGENVKTAKLIYNRAAGDSLHNKASELSAYIYKSPEKEAINYITGLPIERTNYTRDSYTILKGFRNQIKEQFKEFNGRYPTENELNEIIYSLNSSDKNFYNNLAKNRNAIVLDNVAKGERPEILAHELGHLINREGSKKGMRIDRLANVNNNFNNYDYPLFMNENNEVPTLRDSLRKSINNYIEQRRVIKNETLASKTGLSLLEKDLNVEEMRKAEENLSNSLNTYKYKGRIYYKEPLWRKIQIPSLRNPNKLLPKNIIKKLGPTKEDY